ncbi:MAG: hypothetical protein RLZZ292_2495 [Bacteroidota bacterium]|jgi:protein TonB
MKKNIIIAFFLLGFTTLQAQNDSMRGPEEAPVKKTESPSIFSLREVDEKPVFGDGTMTAPLRYVMSNLKYPAIARENNIQGRVVVTFVVEKDGSITDPKVLKDLGGGCGEEALNALKEMPKWKPGKKDGVPVRVQYDLPVQFKLAE